MSNLARPPAPSRATTVHPREQPVSPDDLLADLRAVLRSEPALPGLSPSDYARSHAAFELLSDQRQLISSYLRDRLSDRLGPVSVLSVGCGDGTLDAPLAAGLSDVRPSRPVRYVGVDPYAGSTSAFEAALRDLGQDSLSVEVHTVPFEALPVVKAFDVITFVHSTYYVRDLDETLTAAFALLRPGGELLVLAAPRAELNALVEVLAPPVGGHDQWFSDDVERALEQTGLPRDATATLDAGFDAAAASDDVLDFAVQARLTPELRPLVRAYLDAIAAPSHERSSAPVAGLEPGTARQVPHPVDVFRIVCAG
ncbi:class I SAM-dependent methyltransferase [Nocardioides plantarum]|uniref:Class I SAM-dependent methyltransferase n=1 Tax=Nocardioides plantarum TaxID=29299 RepID=A0ABV5K5I9_9ACTN|nr:class I SAM-dependent methyltransferase [Nocardioides plantarum]